MKGLEAGVVVEQDYSGGLSSEVSSSYPSARDATWSRASEGVADEGEEQGGEDREEGEELELGLSLGAKKVSSTSKPAAAAPWGEYCRILTAKDFPSLVASRVSPISSSSSVSSSSSLGGRGGVVGVAGTKRSADSVAPEVGSNTPSQVVGWPPIRAYRMNSLVNQSKDDSSGDHNFNTHHKKITSHTSNTRHNSNLNSIKEKVTANDIEKKGLVGGSLFVKVNMDGVPIGRKVDLNAHRSYETLALTLEDMFQKPTTPLTTPIQNTKASKLLDGSSEFVLTYEDKDGDWMLVGDVPWGMFLSTVRRLRIMRTSDANGISPRFQFSKVGGLSSKPV